MTILNLISTLLVISWLSLALQALNCDDPKLPYVDGTKCAASCTSYVYQDPSTFAKICQSACPSSSLINDYSNPKTCVSTCPSGLVKYIDKGIGKCILKNECPKANFLLNEAGLECLSSSGYTGFSFSGKKYLQCPYFWSDTDNNCFPHLSSFQKQFLVASSRYFKKKCGSEEIIYDTGNAINTKLCLKTCPYFTNEITNQKNCLKICENKFSTSNLKCVSECPNNEFSIRATKTCVKTCSYFMSSRNDYNCSSDFNDFKNMYLNEKNGRIFDASCNLKKEITYTTPAFLVCAEKCKGFFNETLCSTNPLHFKGSYLLDGTREFKRNCPSDMFKDERNPDLFICSKKCPGYFSKHKQICTNNINNDTFKDMYFIQEKFEFVPACEFGKFIIVLNSTLTLCSDTCSGFYSKSNQLCSYIEKDFKGLYLVENTREFVAQCDPNYYKYRINDIMTCVKECKGFRSKDNSICSNSVNDFVGKYLLEGDNLFVSECEGMYKDETNQNLKLCTKTCSGFFNEVSKNCSSSPYDFKKLYLKEKSKEFVYHCDEGQYKDESNPNLFLCVSTCSHFLIVDEGKCTEICPKNYLVSGRKCVKVCNSETEFFYDGACLSECPVYYSKIGSELKCSEKADDFSNLFLIEASREFLKGCDSSLYFQMVDNKVKLCLTSCPYYYYEESGTRFCTEKCVINNLVLLYEGDRCVGKCSDGKVSNRGVCQ